MRSKEDMQNLFEKCKRDLVAIGIQYGNITSFVVKDLEPNAYGLTKTISHEDGSAESEIFISPIYLEESIPIGSLKGTIFHELLHTVEGCPGSGHEGKWLALAKKVEKAYPGCRVVTKTFRDYGIPEDAVLSYCSKRKLKFVLRCDRCGGLFFFPHLRKEVCNCRNFKCPCGGRKVFTHVETVGKITEKEAAKLSASQIAICRFGEWEQN